MPQTGKVVFSVTVGSGNVNVSGASYSLPITGGSWPTAAYSVIKVELKWYHRTETNAAVSYLIGGTSRGSSDTYFYGYRNHVLYDGKNNIGTSGSYMKGLSTAALVFSGSGTGQIAASTDITLTATWELDEEPSTFTWVDSLTLRRNSAEGGAVSITPGVGAASHKFTVTLAGTRLVDAVSVTDGWYVLITCNTAAALIPDAMDALATAELATYNSSGSLIGTVTKNVLVKVGTSYAPQMACAIDVLHSFSGQTLQRVSQVELQAAPEFFSGATAAAYSFRGPNLNQTGASDTAVTQVLSFSGSLTWTITVTDSRGFVRDMTMTLTGTAYDFPQGSLAAERCDEYGDPQAGGAFIKATPTYTWSGVTGNSLTTRIEMREAGASSWGTPDDTPTLSGDSWILPAAADKRWELRLTLTDAVQTQEELPPFTALAEVATADAFFVLTKKTGQRGFGFGAYPDSDEQVYIHPDWELKYRGDEIGSEILGRLPDEAPWAVYQIAASAAGETESIGTTEETLLLAPVRSSGMWSGWFTYDSTAGTLTAAQDCQLRVSWDLYFSAGDSASVGAALTSQLQVNGTAEARMTVRCGATDTRQTGSAGCLLNLEEGDVLEFTAVTGAGTAEILKDAEASQFRLEVMAATTGPRGADGAVSVTAAQNPDGTYTLVIT